MKKLTLLLLLAASLMIALGAFKNANAKIGVQDRVACFTEDPNDDNAIE